MSIEPVEAAVGAYDTFVQATTQLVPSTEMLFKARTAVAGVCFPMLLGHGLDYTHRFATNTKPSKVFSFTKRTFAAQH